MSGRASTWSLSALLLLLVAGCLDHELAPEDREVSGSAAGVVIAQQHDFADFEDWIAFETKVDGEHGGAKGKITEYLSELPEPDSQSFPIGTKIAKTVETEAGLAPEIHAMVKRGGNFNPRGALDWEFFELQKNAKGTPVIIWRGTKPPNGEKYKNLLNPDANMMEADCNGCHTEAQNDAVLSDALNLSALSP
ncbi:MAG TPA: hypothetical protein VJV78_36900 [Polyangiales bacterium]|nr:hypothetical protein [Polyangiales bacterium]